MEIFKKFNIQKLFFNNKFAFVFSVLVAFFVWASVVINLSPNDNRVIENVKVTVQNNTAEEMELKLFGFDVDTTVDVTVSGKRYAISSTALTADDITVVAKGDYVDSAGTYTLNVTATPKDPNAGFDIVGVSKETISVFYDTLKTEDFNVEAELTAEKIVPDGYIYDDPFPSLTTVSISGPATEINKIDRVVAYATLDEPVTETVNIAAEVIALTANKSNLNYITYNSDKDSCKVTVPVYMKKEIPIGVKYLNAPALYSQTTPKVTITPATLNIAAAKSVMEELEVLYIGSLDFNKLTAKNNKFIFSTSRIDEVKVLDDVKGIKVNVDFSALSTVKMTIPSSGITCLNVMQGYTAQPDSISSVVIVGPEASLEKITEADIYAKVDLSSIGDTEGTAEANAELFVRNHDDCWVYGKYKVNVEITKQ